MQVLSMIQNLNITFTSWQMGVLAKIGEIWQLLAFAIFVPKWPLLNIN
jgi:hypothetical protein